MPSNVKHEVAIKSKKFEMADNEHEHEESWRFPELLWRLRLRQLKIANTKEKKMKKFCF